MGVGVALGTEVSHPAPWAHGAYLTADSMAMSCLLLDSTVTCRALIDDMAMYSGGRSLAGQHLVIHVV